MDQVIIYNKSCEERLQEYMNIFSYGNVLPSWKIKNIWSSYLELSVDPQGWQAIWNIPRVTCEELEVEYPTVVLVHVEQVDFVNHLGFIRIVAVQDDIDVPERHSVPLIQLWPTKQDKAVNLESTANSLDALRFFYNHLYMPWDDEQDETIDWVEHHLETRLCLYYDSINGAIPRVTTERYKALISDAKQLYLRKSRLEMEIGEMPHTDDDKIHSRRAQFIVEIEIQLKQIENEIKLLENPLTRSVLIKRHLNELPYISEDPMKHWIVLGQKSCDEHLNFLKQIETDYPNTIFRNATSFETILNSMNGNNMVILSPETHHIKQVVTLDDGCVIKGLHDTLISTSSNDIMFDFCGNVTLENITLDAEFAQRGLIVRKGKTTMKNCKIIGAKSAVYHQGFFVMPHTSLELIGCSVTGFTTAIVASSRAEITMKSCTIKDVSFGLKIQDNCAVNIEDTLFQNCEEYGVSIETQKVCGEGEQIGNFALLKM